MSPNQHDASHFSFVEILRILHKTGGPAFAKSALVCTAVSAAEASPERHFSSMDEVIKSFENLDNPVASFEGETRYYGNGIFGLARCPFEAAIVALTGLTDDPRQHFDSITDEMNRPSSVNDALRVGCGAAVTPFCAVHQPIRSALGERIKIAGQSLRIYQLGCKTPDGHVGISDTWVTRAGIDRRLVEDILNENMCCYCVRLEPDD